MSTYTQIWWILEGSGITFNFAAKLFHKFIASDADDIPINGAPRSAVIDFSTFIITANSPELSDRITDVYKIRFIRGGKFEFQITTELSKRIK